VGLVRVGRSVGDGWVMLLEWKGSSGVVGLRLQQAETELVPSAPSNREYS